MFLDLIVAEFEHLELVRESRLSGLCLGEEVHNFAIRVGLLDVLVVEVDDSVAIREGLTLDTIVEDDLFLAVLVDTLDLTIVTYELLDNFLVLNSFAVVLLGELKTEVFFLVRERSPRR